MISGALELLSSVASAVASWLGFQTKKLELKNTATMQEAAKAQAAADAQGRVEDAIGRKDVKAIREELAE